MGLYRHEPFATATNQYSRLRVGGYRDLTRNATKITPLNWGVAIGYRMYVNLFDLRDYCVDFLLR